MSTCINRSHPEFIELLNNLQLVDEKRYSENVVAALVSLWQQNNPVGDAFPTSTELDAYRIQIQGDQFPKMSDAYFGFISNSLSQNWSGERESVSSLFNRFKRSIGDSTRGSEVVLPEEALKRLLNSSEAGIITPELLTQAIDALNNYLNYSSSYIAGVVKGLDDLLNKPEATSKQIVSALHFSFEIANNYKKQLEAIFPTNVNSEFAEMANYFKEPAYKFLTEKSDKIKLSIAEIEGAYNSRLKNQVVNILYDNLKNNVEAVDELFDKEIRMYDQALATTTNPAYRKTLQYLKNKELEKKRKYRISKENIEKWLGEPRGAGVFSYFRSAAYMKDPAVRNIADYIFTVLEDAKQGFYQEVNELQDIMERIQNEYKAPIDLRLDIKKIYAPYTRETVDQYGNFALAIQTQMKEQELLNEYIKLTKALEQAATDEEADVLEEQRENFLETYVERRYIPEVYEFRKLLPKHIRKKMNLLRAERQNLIENLDSLKIEEGDLEKLRAIDKELADMQKEYTENGVLKEGQDLIDARAIKAYNKRAEELGVNDFYLTPASKRNFLIALNDQVQRNKDKQNSNVSQEEKEEAQNQLDSWLSIFARTVINPKFYEMRNRITSEIDEILSSYGPSSIGNQYKELFSILAGYRDANGVYDGTRVSEELKARSKEIEETIENLKGLEKKQGMTPADKERLKELFNELKTIQSTSPTEYYYDEVERQKTSIRSRLLQSSNWDNNVLEEQVERLYEKSQWFYANHIKVTKYIDGQKTEVWEPLSVWKVTLPTESAAKKLTLEAKQEADRLEALNDPSLKEEIEELRNFRTINRTSPSKVWYSYRVNPRYENPKYNPDLNFKVVQGAYYNDQWDRMTDSQKSIARDLLALYRRQQESNYKSNRLNTLIPYVRKEGEELAYDTIMAAPEKGLDKTKKLLRGGYFKDLKDRLKKLWNQEDLQDENIDDVYGDVNQFDAFGNPIIKTGKAIYMRYTKPLAQNLMSYDIMKSIGLYMGDAHKFRALREHQSEILAMQTVLEGAESLPEEQQTKAYKLAFRKTKAKLRRFVFSQKEPTAEEVRISKFQAAQNTKGLINRVMYGENLKKFNNRLYDRLTSVGNYSLGQVGRMSIDQNLESTVKNLFAGIVQNFIAAGVYDINLKDLLKANVKGFKAAKDFIANPQVGNRPYSLRLMDHFSVILGREFTAGKDIKSTLMRKHGNLFKTNHRLREATEYELQTSVAYAILDKVNVQLESGGEIKLSEAFEIVNNKFVPKQGVIIPEGLIKRVRSKIKHMNHHAQGIYDQLYQPEGNKYVIYRTVLFMGKWIVPKYDRLFGEEVINHSAAIRTQGAYNAIFHYMKDIIADGNNIAAAFKYAGTKERKAVQTIMMQTISWATMAYLSSLIKNCDDDKMFGACDEVNWVLKGMLDEVEALDPFLWTPNFVYGYVYQKSSKSAAEKSAYSLASPLFKLYNFYTEGFSLLMDPFEPYYKYTPAGKINWDVVDPSLAGLPNAAVLALRYTGLNQLDVSPRRAEFKSRQLSFYSPKWYTERTKTRYVDRFGRKKKIKRKSEKEEDRIEKIKERERRKNQ